MKASTTIVIRPMKYTAVLSMLRIQRIRRLGKIPNKISTVGMEVVTTERMRQASRSAGVGKGKFQAKQWIAPNPEAKIVIRNKGQTFMDS